MTTETRPYPNVRHHKRTWEAYRPSNGRKHYLGSFPTPEAARHAVLIAQAEHLEAKAARYRAEAAELGGGEGSASGPSAVA